MRSSLSLFFNAFASAFVCSRSAGEALQLQERRRVAARLTGHALIW